MTIRAIQITLSPMVWRIDLQQLVSGADPTHKLARCDAHSSVAVGTRIAPRPPHRSRRALLTHRAPPLGFGVEAVTWQRV